MAENRQGKSGVKGSGESGNKDVLGAALRANLKKRKAQASARAATDLKKTSGTKKHKGT